MKKRFLLVVVFLLLFSCNSKKFRISQKNLKKQQEELLREEKLHKIQFIRKFYDKELTDLDLLEKGQIGQDQYFSNLKNYIMNKRNSKELSNVSLFDFFKIKETPFNNYKDFLEDNIGFLSTIKSYYYLQEKSIQHEVMYLLRSLVNLKKIVTIIPEVSYEKRKRYN